VEYLEKQHGGGGVIYTIKLEFIVLTIGNSTARFKNAIYFLLYQIKTKLYIYTCTVYVCKL